MGENSKIEWCHHTFNPWRGCTKVSAGCVNCYAEKMSHRNPAVLGEWGPGAKRVLASESYWRQPFKWNRDAAAAGERRRVFCASLGDVFDEEVGNAWRDRLLGTIEACEYLDWLLLTKRPASALEYFCSRDIRAEQWENLWLGVSVENQAAADERIPILFQIPAAVRFLSCEPLLGPIDFTVQCPPHYAAHLRSDRISWVIVGGESGPKARPMHPDWARSLRDQCHAAGVPFFFKQWGEWAPDDCGAPAAAISKAPLYSWNSRPDYACVHRVGKKAAGRLLDGREWNEFPEARP